MISAAEINNNDYPEIEHVIDKILPCGLSTLAGRPKIGKSWLSLQMAYHISTGQPFFGNDVKQGGVIYLALEDSERRLKSRMNTQGWDFSLMPDVNFQLEWPSFYTKNSMQMLFNLISAKEPSLTIIDTIMRVAPHNKGDNVRMQKIYETLQNFCNKGNSILLVDHHRKPNGYEDTRDPLDDIYGTTSKGGTIDAYLSLYKPKNKNTGNLFIGGRDIIEDKLDVFFNKANALWQLDIQSPLNDATNDLLMAIAENPGKRGSELATILNKSEGTISKQIKPLITEKYIKYDTDGAAKLYKTTKAGEELALLLLNN